MREQEDAVQRRRRAGVDKVTRVLHSIGAGIQGWPGASASSAETSPRVCKRLSLAAGYKRPGEEVAAGQLVGPTAPNHREGDGTKVGNEQRARVLQSPEIGPNPQGRDIH